MRWDNGGGKWYHWNQCAYKKNKNKPKAKLLDAIEKER